MKAGTVIKAQDENHYTLLAKDSGFPHKEDEGLWQAYKVDWNSKTGEWQYNDDDIWMLTDDFQVVAKEIGWDRRREEI